MEKGSLIDDLLRVVEGAEKSVRPSSPRNPDSGQSGGEPESGSSHREDRHRADRHRADRGSESE
jgi:hypothetical protein